MPVSRARSGPLSRVAPSLTGISYYGGSVAVRVSPDRRSRIYPEKTLRTWRCPSVPFQAPCLLLTGESVPSASLLLVSFHISPYQMCIQCHHFLRGVMGRGLDRAELRFDSPSLTMRSGLAERRHTRLLPASVFAACSCPL